MDDRFNEAEVLNQINRIHFQQGNIDEALAHSMTVLRLVRETGNQRVEGMILQTIANAYAALDLVVEANTSYAASLAVLEAIENWIEVARTRWSYGQFLIRQGNRTRGIALMAECVDYEQQIGHAQAEEHAALVEHLRAGGELPT